ncbi:MAG: AAA family ATPase [Candidatus Zambryskibacteria bacterium CG22_combo_CG10-13_8_21_14_all_42_17]|uniref:AAA family ATPase n=1 Tax=Candidatus Zambryskibacteria bacterium CG22_combo_CG10-13_8_21_14_all_42_17 TaxID=1975118 RepID=A0A2H0BEK7_9BACT|nr:MAG: AAA family ATPase [Candidatus Zambryskibacteria bacterium CG22_combo_CG10-13_8_21_14_all_42_17]
MTQKQALEILKTGANVFLSGEPGSGKTHTVNQYVSYLRSMKVEVAITASTGIAATHIGGMTIHSWSGIGIKRNLNKYDLDRIATNERIAKRIRQAKVLIIDEVSMLGPGTLSMVDMVCREVKDDPQAFGGLQVLLVGDFFQLPPVVRRDEQTLQNTLLAEATERFAYDASCWPQAHFITCYLTEQYRQDDETFLSILSAIRRNEYNEDHHAHIEKRKVTRANALSGIPRLFSHNDEVERVNDQELAKISEKGRTFEMSSQGAPLLVSTLKKGCLSPEILKLKIGAKVMFTKNNPQIGFVNGTLGEVEELSPYGFPVIRTRNHQSIIAEPMAWTVEEGGGVRARITQVPLRLAWAITVHKSQGMSLDEAVMDLSDVFEFGQGYVALSRVRRLSGLHLLGWNKQTFQVHPEVLKKDVAFRDGSSAAEEAFSKMAHSELILMHNNFVKAVGGHPPVKKQKI